MVIHISLSPLCAQGGRLEMLPHLKILQNVKTEDPLSRTIQKSVDSIQLVDL